MILYFYDFFSSAETILSQGKKDVILHDSIIKN